MGTRVGSVRYQNASAIKEKQQEDTDANDLNFGRTGSGSCFHAKLSPDTFPMISKKYKLKQNKNTHNLSLSVPRRT
eukprot:2977942-Amphidinium_carterae.1